MAVSKGQNHESPDARSRCADCGHIESEHAATGTRPCMAMTGDDLVVRDFCACDGFRPKAAQAA